MTPFLRTFAKRANAAGRAYLSFDTHRGRRLEGEVSDQPPDEGHVGRGAVANPDAHAAPGPGPAGDLHVGAVGDEARSVDRRPPGRVGRRIDGGLAGGLARGVDDE